MNRRRLVGLQALAIVVAGLWVYAPALRGGWIWDDAAEVVHNPALPDPSGIGKAWVAPAGPDYFPLKTTLQWAVWRLWGPDPFAFHLAGVALHLASALLFWRLLVKLRRDPSPAVRLEWLGGLLFAVHPVAVESVAWIAELKNTLSLPLLLAAMIAYLDFLEGGRRRVYLLSLGAFVLAMLAKSTVVMFPAVALLYLWWRRGRVRGRDLLDAAPFFGAAFVLGLVTVWFQGHRAIDGADLAVGGALSRLATAGLAIAFYFGKCVLPLGLMPFYPRWDVLPPSPWQFWPWLALGLGVAWLLAKGGSRGRGALFGLGFFGLNLLPVLGLIPMSYSRIAPVADHFAYLPMLGLIGLAVGGATALADRLRLSRRGLLAPLGTLAAALLVALAVAGRAHAAIYRSEDAFWAFALERNPQAWIAHNDWGEILLDAGRLREAAAEFREALRLRPDYAEAHNNLGNALARAGQWPAAAGEFEAAISLNPRPGGFHSNLGNALLQMGQCAAAARELQISVDLGPDFAELRNNLGEALARSGRLNEAVGQFEAALRMRPGFKAAHHNLGVALESLGRTAEAQAEFEAAGRP